MDSHLIGITTRYDRIPIQEHAKIIENALAGVKQLEGCKKIKVQVNGKDIVISNIYNGLAITGICAVLETLGLRLSPNFEKMLIIVYPNT